MCSSVRFMCDCCSKVCRAANRRRYSSNDRDECCCSKAETLVSGVGDEEIGDESSFNADIGGRRSSISSTSSESDPSWSSSESSS